MVEKIIETMPMLLLLEAFLRKRPVVIAVELRGESSLVTMEGKKLFTFSGDLEECVVSLLNQYGLQKRESHWERDEVTPYLFIKGRDVHQREGFEDFRQLVISSNKPLLINPQGNVFLWAGRPLFELSKAPSPTDRSNLAYILKGLVGAQDIHHLAARLDVRELMLEKA